MPHEDHYRSLKEHVEKLGMHEHACMAYDDREQQVTAIAHYMMTGLGLGEQCLYIANIKLSDFVLRVLRGAGIDVDEALQKEELILATPDEIYLPNGKFDPDYTMGLAPGLVAAAVAKGFKALRCAADMTWAAEAKLSFSDLVEYEKRVNSIFSKHPIRAICQYNTNVFDAATLRALMDVHPVTIFGGAITPNPAFEQQVS